VRLEADDAKALLVPAGFAHGYMTLASSSVVAYHMFAPYVAEAQRGILWNDPDLAINWPATPRVIGERDRNFPFFSHITEKYFQFPDFDTETISDISFLKEVS
jgi:dTDP-4-dehydrorhamnose 3,5-epimerase